MHYVFEMTAHMCYYVYFSIALPFCAHATLEHLTLMRFISSTNQQLLVRDRILYVEALDLHQTRVIAEDIAKHKLSSFVR